MIDYAPGEADETRRRREMEHLYRNVFSSPEGQKVLGHILMENHYGVPLNNDAERIEYNVGIAIARMSGIMGEIDNLLKIGED